MPNKSCQSQQHIKCQNCSISELCLPFSLNDQELSTLDDIIDRKRPIHKGDKIFTDGQEMQSLYAIRSGTFKTFTVNEQGEEQITGFHLAGDLLGFPYNNLDELSNTMPKLKKQVLRLMSHEIRTDQEMLTLLNRKNAEQRVATFLVSLSERYQARGLSSSEYRLTMTRSDIGNYIGLTVETISRLLNRFHKNGLIKVDGKLISILEMDDLIDTAAL